MTRFVLVATVLSYLITPIALCGDGSDNLASAQPPPANLAPVYVKIIWPCHPATSATKMDRLAIESWITENVDNRHKSNFMAITGWIPLVEEPLETTDLWDGTLDGVHHACQVGADITERKDGRIKITFGWWDASGSRATASLKDEPGSHAVVPVTEAKLKHGMPHVAIFIGVPLK